MSKGNLTSSAPDNKTSPSHSPGVISVDITISSQELKIQHPALAHGSFGIVYRAVWKGKPVAVKQFTGSDVDGDAKKFLREATLMFQTGFKSPYTMPLLGICLEPYSLVMKLMPILARQNPSIISAVNPAAPLRGHSAGQRPSYYKMNPLNTRRLPMSIV